MNLLQMFVFIISLVVVYFFGAVFRVTKFLYTVQRLGLSDPEIEQVVDCITKKALLINHKFRLVQAFIRVEFLFDQLGNYGS